MIKTIISLFLAVLLAGCASKLPELQFADGSKRIPINPRPIPLQREAASGDAQMAAKAAGAQPPKRHAVSRCSRKEHGAKGAQDSSKFLRWLFPIVH